MARAGEMRVLVDLHHGVLYEALAMLFVDRFGWQLDAYVDGYYVTTPGRHWADFPPRVIHCLTTEDVRRDPPDIVISTVGGTRQQMHALAVQVGATYIDHVGNAWDEPITDLVLRSVVGDYGVPYHPEFHRVPWRAPSGNLVAAFHGSLAVSPCRDLFDAAAAAHPDLRFVIYGTPQMPLYPFEVAEAMQEAAVIWHDKEADGYGFTVHEAFAAGRPVVGHNHYRGKFAEPLWEGGVSIDIIGQAEAVRAIRGLFEDREKLLDMAIRARMRFAELVDFDAEAERIHDFLSVAVPA